MIYYRKYVGDYATATAHLSLIEHGAYTLLLDHYYSTERGLPNSWATLHRIAHAQDKAEKAAVESVVREFFILDEPTNLWRQKRADQQIELDNEAREKARRSGKVGAEKRWRGNNGVGHPDVAGYQAPDPDHKNNGNPNGHPNSDPNSDPIGNPNSSQSQSNTSKDIYDDDKSIYAREQTPPPPDDKHSSDMITRCISISAMLCKAERRRGKIPRIHQGDPRVIEWAASGIKDEAIMTAYHEAVTARDVSGDTTPVNAGFIDVFLQQRHSGTQPRRASGINPSMSAAFHTIGIFGRKEGDHAASIIEH